MTRFSVWLANFFSRQELHRLESELHSCAIELSQRDRELLTLQSENDRLKNDLLSRPTQAEVQLLKVQVDQLSLQYQRRQVYGTLSHIPAIDQSIPLSADLNQRERTQSPSNSRARAFSEQMKSKLSEMFTREYQDRMAPIPGEKDGEKGPVDSQSSHHDRSSSEPLAS